MSATDQQMQQFCNERIRPRAEQLRALINAFRDDKTAIDAAYDRAANGAAWADARTDGPPKLLASQDVLVFNAFASDFLACIDGLGANDAEKAGHLNGVHANLAVFEAACVRPVNN